LVTQQKECQNRPIDGTGDDTGRADRPVGDHALTITNQFADCVLVLDRLLFFRFWRDIRGVGRAIRNALFWNVLCCGANRVEKADIDVTHAQLDLADDLRRTGVPRLGRRQQRIDHGHRREYEPGNNHRSGNGRRNAQLFDLPRERCQSNGRQNRHDRRHDNGAGKIKRRDDQHDGNQRQHQDLNCAAIKMTDAARPD